MAPSSLDPHREKVDPGKKWQVHKRSQRSGWEIPILALHSARVSSLHEEWSARPRRLVEKFWQGKMQSERSVTQLQLNFQLWHIRTTLSHHILWSQSDPILGYSFSMRCFAINRNGYGPSSLCSPLYSVLALLIQVLVLVLEFWGVCKAESLNFYPDFTKQEILSRIKWI